MATVLRNDAKNQITKILLEQGYKPYARLLSLFDIYLTDEVGVIGYMEPGKAKIVLNCGLSINQVSVIVRHEILHEFLDHARRKQAYDDKAGKQGDHNIGNIAMDYEISNKGYTEKDKATARAIVLGDKVLRGLVTEDEYPDWSNKTFEEMYEELLKQGEEQKEKFKKILQRSQALSKKAMEDLSDQIGELEQEADNQNNQEIVDAASKLQDEVDDMKPSAAQSGDGSKRDKSSRGGKDQPFKSPEEIQDLEERVKEIKRIFSDLKAKQEILDNSKEVKTKEKRDKMARDADRQSSSGLNQFRLSLNRFIRDMLEEDNDDTYSRLNPSYEYTDFIFPGQMRMENKHIPSINVYWDVSGSFSDPKKTEGARQAIATLNKYVENGDIVIRPYYFADRVSDTKEGAGGGTQGTPIIEHIEKTKPMNVIVITDSDITDISSLKTVPGAVWMLFYGSKSDNLIQNLRGKKESRWYMVW